MMEEPHDDNERLGSEGALVSGGARQDMAGPAAIKPEEKASIGLQ